MQATVKSLVVVLALSVLGCASVTPPEQRTASAENMMKDKGWLRLNINAPPFVLRSYLPAEALTQNDKVAGKVLTVYIEGDGFAWKTRYSPSADPTPIDPVALKLALQHPDHQVAYLARPCQFVTNKSRAGCTESFWTSHRFAQDVVDSSNEAINELLKRTSSSSLRLVGFSGGGAIAALVAAKRSDVIHLVTVAGNLDHKVWTEIHSVEPLDGSLNPAVFAENLSGVRQTHLVGGADKVIPPLIAKTFIGLFEKDSDVSLKIFPNNTHNCCWSRDWSKIFAEDVRVREKN